MDAASTVSPVLAKWRRLSQGAAGRWLFARIVTWRAPYFATIGPRLLELRPGLCRASMAKRRRVENHIGTVHALAMGNLVELAAGLVTEVTIPAAMRWIPRGMTIEYLKPAATGVTAAARLEKSTWDGAENVGVAVSVQDATGVEVVRAVVTMYISPRRGQPDPAQ
ncbi:MAG: hotdog fold domain-containing protein [Steroidobacteraceae bacterium]